MPRRRIWLLAAVLALLGGWFLWPARSDEDRIRAVIGAIAAGAEEGDVGDVIDHVSERYRGAEAGLSLNRKTLRSALALQFLRRGPIGVLLGPIEVEVEGDTAHARFDAAVTETSGGWSQLLPTNADGWHLEVDFAREEGDVWRVTGHTRSSWLRGAGAPAP